MPIANNFIIINLGHEAFYSHAQAGDGMRVTQAFRFELDPNCAARVALAKHVGAARFAWNWGLARCRAALERGERIPSAMELHKEWNRWKRENAPWWVEVSKCAPQGALQDLERAIKRWRRKLARFPQFKRKKLFSDNGAHFTGSIRVLPRHVQLPRLGKVRTKERTDKLLALLAEQRARILFASISREADRWHVSLTCEAERPDPTMREGEPVGIDLGLEYFLVLSDGTQIKAPKPLARLLLLLKRRSRQFSRKQRGARNYEKAALRLARLHRRIRNVRRDFLHKLTTWLAKTKSVIVVEDLNVRGLGRTHLSRSLHDVSFGAFRRMLEYKARWYGAKLIVVPRSFPSTRWCSQCGCVGPRLPLSRRIFKCTACGFECDRDLNAAFNLRAYGLAHPTGSTASSAGRGTPQNLWILWGPRTPVETPLAAEWPSGQSTSHGSVKQKVAG